MNDNDLDNPVAFHRAVLAIAVGIGLILIAGWIGICLTVGVANAHEAPSGWKYDAWCCSNRDCAEIPDKAVRVIPGGYQITVTVGDHPLVTRVHVFQVEQSKARPSPDGKFHLCLYPTEDNLRCFYAPVPGF